jgi:uncharacterized protein YprB with RNaseH-like and TPR domain/predicted nuclease with RNAse H fold/dephospho-CoA kinase
MLKASFQHLPRISQRKEYALWRSGIVSWDDFETKLNGQLPLFASLSRDDRSALLDQSRNAFRNGDADFFGAKLPRRDHYRIALAFPADTLFLDIETTGLSRYYDHITLVGWSFGSDYGAYVKGQDTGRLCSALDRAKVLVTFNGLIFDLPFLRQEFPDLEFPTAHVDLRFLARRADLSGGQKAIENQLGVKRNSKLQDVTSKTAPVLWHRYRRGDTEALKLLVMYNHADVEGMKHIFDVVVRRVLEKEEVPRNLWPKRFLTHSYRSQMRSIRSLKNYGGVPIVKYKGRLRPAVSLRELANLVRTKTIVGIDLTGSERRASGWCVLEGSRAETSRLSSDDEIFEATLKAKPCVVSIDSPLSLPQGRMRATDDDPGRSQYGIMRICERILKRRGINVYPCLIPSMQRLTERGIRMAERFRAIGMPVIESYPGAAQDIMGLPRKRASLELLRSGLVDFGLSRKSVEAAKSHDEIDAITSALVGLFFWSGRFEAVGTIEDGYLIIPALTADSSPWLSRSVVGISGPIAAGKTTAAEHLARKGFHYSRFSLVLSKILEERGLTLSRELLQETGAEINRSPGQRWLCQKLVADLPKGGNVVIDGLRHPEDHAHLIESYGPAFLHVNVNAPDETRLNRYLELGLSKNAFWQACSHPVESSVNTLGRLAHLRIQNTSNLDEFLERIWDQVAQTLPIHGG